MKLGRMARIGRTLAPILVLAAALCIPALAVAKVTVPPGSTEGDQYFEEVPNGAGSGGPNKPDGAGGAGGGGAGGGGAQVAATQQLDQLGPDGQKAAALANANKPPTSSAGQNNHPVAPTQQASSTEGDGGMGVWFPLIIAASFVVALAFLLRRRLNPAS